MTTSFKRSLVAFTLICVVACDSATSEDHTANAEQFLAKGEYRAAMIELKNALQKDGESARARWLLGELQLNLGDAAAAEKELSRAASLGWPASETTPKLARAMLAMGKYEEVLELDATDLEPGARASVLAAQSLSKLAEGDTEAATRLSERALQEAPENIDAQLAQARLMLLDGRLKQSLAASELILVNHPKSQRAWSLKADALVEKNELTEAISAYDQAIKLPSANISERLKRGLVHMRLQDTAAAQEDADALLKIAPQYPGSHYLQGLIHFQNKDYGKSIESLTQIDTTFGAFPMALFYLGNAHFLENNLDQAALSAGRFVNTNPGNVAGRKLLATIHLQQGKLESVQELLQPVIDHIPDDVGALNLMANALIRSGETDQGITMLETIARLQPDSPAAQVRLGAGLLMGGEEGKAQQHIETALALDPEFQQADILLVMNHMQSGDLESAINAAKAYQKRQPDEITPHNLLGRVYLVENRPEEAREAFRIALELDAGDPSANHQLAQIALQEDDTATARAHYETTLKHYPELLAAQLQLASLDLQQGNEDEMVSRLEQAIATHPTQLEPRLVLARYYLDKGKPAQVTPTFTGLDDIRMKSPQVLQLTALAQLAQSQHSDALYTFDELVDATPESANFHYLLGVAAAGTGDEKRAEAAWRRALELEEDFPPAMLALARAELERDENEDEHSEYVEKLIALAPDSPEVLQLAAATAERQGDLKAAVGFASAAFETAPSSRTVSMLSVFMTAVGQKSAARQLLENWLEENPEDVTVRMVLANDQQISNDVKGAMQQYDEVLRLNPENPIALNNMAWYLQDEDLDKALDYARKAHSLAPESPEMLDTLGVLEHRNGDSRRGARYIERALALAPDNPSILYHSAMIQAEMGKKQEALATLRHLMALQKNAYPEQKDAESLLKRLTM